MDSTLKNRSKPREQYLFQNNIFNDKKIIYLIIPSYTGDSQG